MTSGPRHETAPSARRGAVAVVVRERPVSGHSTLAIGRGPGAFCFPGGGIEAGESEEQALVREFQEELGAAIRPLRCVWRSTTRWHVELAWWLGTFGARSAASPPIRTRSRRFTG